MIYNNVIAREVAEYLLEIKAVVLNPKEPFTWTSGIKSPIYCDNRKTLSFPKVRNLIKTSFADTISEEFKNCDVVAGVATAGIPHGALVADVLNKPFVYVRDKPKAHGLENQIEGKLDKGQKVVVIEDLISTGGRFTYGFDKAVKAFEAAHCRVFTLSDYPTLLEIAIKNDYVKPEERETLLQWYQNPEGWLK
jgi:orotate phosphoribosyltransferase